MKKLHLFLVLGIALSFSMVSCNKSEDVTNTKNYDKQTALAKDYAIAQDVYSDIFDLLCQASRDSALKSSSHTSVIVGATVVYTPATKTFSFTFPTKATNGKSGNFTAVLDKNGNFEEVGTKAQITFSNYSVGGSTILGSNDITNRGKIGGKTTGITITYTDSVYNAQIIKGADTISANAVYSVDWMLGDTTTITDDQYLFSGTISGTVLHQNKSFTATVTANNKVLVTTACQYIQSGIVNAVMNTVDINNQPVVTNVIVDFITADGCANFVQINMDGIIITVPQQQ